MALLRHSPLSLSIGVQAVGAAVVLGSNGLLLATFGAAAYQQLATLLSIFVAANYFDFGYLGKVRIAAASSALSDLERRRITGQLFWAFTVRVAVFELAIALLDRFAGDHMPTLGAALHVAAIAPLVIHVNAYRAYLEGRALLVASGVIRAGFGIILGVSPFVASAAFGDAFAFPWVVAICALILTACFFVVAIGRDGANVRSAVKLALPRAGVITTLETAYVLAGAAFLYGDRYALLSLERTAHAGIYVFVLELVSRSSLLYVPTVMNSFPNLVTSAERGFPTAYALARTVDRNVILITGTALLASVAGAALLGAVLPAPGGWRFAVGLAIPLSIAYTINASTYLHQRFTVIVHDRPAIILAGYLCLAPVVAVTFFSLYRLFGVAGVAVTFLLRTIIENLMLRSVLRSYAARRSTGL